MSWRKQLILSAVAQLLCILATLLLLSLTGCDMPEGARRCETACNARGRGYQFKPSNGCAQQSCTCVADADGGR